MAYDPNVLHRAVTRLEAQRKRHADAQRAERDALYRKLPRLAGIDAALRKTMVQVARAALAADGDPSDKLDRIRAENRALEAERDTLLSGAGYPADALDEKPYCAKCGDTGRFEGHMCDCLRVLYTQEQIAELSKLLDLGEQSFDRFDLSWYSDQPWQNLGVSPRDNMKAVLDVCRNYAAKFGRFYFDNLFLFGATGLGKTFLSACIARVVAENGFSVVYDTVGNVFAAFEAEKFSRNSAEGQDARDETYRYLNCDLLILDDLGSEMTTPFVQSALYQLVNSRLTGEKRTVISSNLTTEELRRRYSPQIVSRLEGEYRALPFFGDDIRLLRKQRGPARG